MLQVDFRVTSNESLVFGIWLGLIPGARIGDAKQRDSQTNIARRADDSLRQEILIVVRPTVRRVMKIMKLADRRDAAEGHFQKRHPRSVVDIFRPQARRG